MPSGTILLLLLAVGFCAGAAASPAAAETNVPLCFAIANNYNSCLRQHQGGGPPRPRYDDGEEDGDRPARRRGRYDPDAGAYDRGYGRRPDYDYGVGYDDHRRRRARNNPCAIWLLQMRANHCI